MWRGTHRIFNLGEQMCLSCYCRKAFYLRKVVLACCIPLLRSQRPTLLAITTEGPWIRAGGRYSSFWPWTLWHVKIPTVLSATAPGKTCINAAKPHLWRNGHHHQYNELPSSQQYELLCSVLYGFLKRKVMKVFNRKLVKFNTKMQKSWVNINSFLNDHSIEPKVIDYWAKSQISVLGNKTLKKIDFDLLST